MTVLQRLCNRRILLAVSGGIAVYKAAELVRRLRDQGADVRVLMSRAATEFVTPLTFQALSGHPVHTDLLDPAAEAAMGHIELARWADCVLVAPATADTLARLTEGRADELLTAVCLATRARLAVAPAMNQAMWNNPATQANLAVLRERGITVFGPAAGSQACGETGYGRLLEAEALAQCLAEVFESRALDGVRLLITAGPTREAIDPVRFISNHSSGRMGFALAQAGVDAGARVTLVAGPVRLSTPERVERVDVVSADDMRAAVMSRVQGCDLFIGTAAVADYRPQAVADQKIKKGAETLDLALVRNPDIIAEVARQQPKPFVVGFAAETDRVLEHARQKLVAKNLDLIITNDVAAPGIGFESDENAVTMIDIQGQHVFPRASKTQLAHQLIADIAHRYRAVR